MHSVSSGSHITSRAQTGSRDIKNGWILSGQPSYVQPDLTPRVLHLPTHRVYGSHTILTINPLFPSAALNRISHCNISIVLGEVRTGPSCITLIGVSLQSVRTTFLRCGYAKTAGCCDLLARLQGNDAVNEQKEQHVV
jgi:hypothetical protein